MAENPLRNLAPNVAREMARQYLQSTIRKGSRLDDPATLADYLSDVALETTEHFVIVAVDSRLRVIARRTVAHGGQTQVSISPREVFRAALELGANAIFIAHNHPSGDPEPSADDLALTQLLIAAGTLIGVQVMDHIVLTPGEYVSLRQTEPRMFA